MTVLNKSDIPRPSLPAETVTVPELNGDVIVQGLLLKDRLALFSVDPEDQFKHIAKVLAVTIMDASRQPIYTAAEWEIFGAQHIEVTVSLLFDKALRLSGVRKDEDSEKKELPQS